MKPDEGAQGFGRSIVLALLTGTYAVSFVDRQIVAILMEPIKRSFDLSDSWLGVLAGPSFALFYVTMGIPVALLADRGNRKVIIATSLALFSAATALCGLAAQFWQLALARVLVGVGEAGTTAPSQSALADLYAPAERPRVFAIFTSGVNLGLLVALVLGGFIADRFGWRWAFLAAAVPGLLIAIAIAVGVREPPRSRVAPVQDQGLKATMRFLLARRSFLWMTIGGALCSFVGYAHIQWMGTFLIRVHHVSATTAGLVLGLLYGIGGGCATIMAGALAGNAARRDPRLLLGVPALLLTLGWLFLLPAVYVGSVDACVLLYAVPAVLSAAYQPPILAALQDIVPPHMRATAAAILAFAFNSIGIALGPLFVGVLSDGLGLANALAATACATPVAAFFLWRAGQRYCQDRTQMQSLSRSSSDFGPADTGDARLHPTGP